MSIGDLEGSKGHLEYRILKNECKNKNYHLCIQIIDYILKINVHIKYHQNDCRLYGWIISLYLTQAVNTPPPINLVIS